MYLWGWTIDALTVRISWFHGLFKNKQNIFCDAESKETDPPKFCPKWLKIKRGFVWKCSWFTAKLIIKIFICYEGVSRDIAVCVRARMCMCRMLEWEQVRENYICFGSAKILHSLKEAVMELPNRHSTQADNTHTHTQEHIQYANLCSHQPCTA